MKDLTYREAGEQFTGAFGNHVQLPSDNYVAPTEDLIPIFDGD